MSLPVNTLPASSAGAAPPTRLADRLDALRSKYVVGRSVEIERFRATLRQRSAPLALVYVHGPGGVGKTVLLREFGKEVTAAGRPLALVDGRDVEPTPDGFLRGLRPALGLDGQPPPWPAVAGRDDPVLLIDTYEALAPIDAWLRDELLPQLPANTLVVVAGRNPPAAAWRADPAWSELMHVLPLRNLAPQESRRYLRARGVPAAQHASVLAFTHGHPLALSLLADLLVRQQRDRAGQGGKDWDMDAFRPECAPDVVRTLLERFVDDVPTPEHRQALAVCAHARTTTESLLADVVGGAGAAGAADPEALFSWLRDLPFVEQGEAGLSPHDLAREVLDADLRWRDPAAYAALHARILGALVRRLHGSSGPAQQHRYFDLLYLARHNATNRTYYDWTSFGHLSAETATPAEHPEIVAMVRRHEGEASARIAGYWLGRQPQAFVAFRTPDRQLAGFTAAVCLETVTAADAEADPALAAAWQFTLEHGALRPGEVLLHHRFFVGREGYQDVTTHNMVAVVATMRWLTTPRLAWSFAAVAEPERWRPMFEAIRFPYAPAAAFQVGGRRYGVFVHDWRVDPPSVWIEVKAALEAASSPPLVGETAPLVVLSRPDFEAAVRQALRDYHRPALATNPLLRSRLAREHAGGAPAAATLRDLLRETTQALGAHSRDEKLLRAVAVTYLEHPITQERAAERLGLPFNTYRYRLAAGTQRLVDALWQRDLDATGA